MKKKFSSTLSITLAGLLAVGGIGASPMTAYAATNQPIKGDKISFVVGNAGGTAKTDGTITTAGSESVTFKTANPLEIDDTTGVSGSNKVTIDDIIPGQTAVLEGTFSTLDPGYHFAWVDRDNKNIYETANAAFSTVIVPDQAVTLYGDYVGDIITVSLYTDPENDETVGATVSKRFKATDFMDSAAAATALAAPVVEGYTFTGWDLDGDKTKVDIPVPTGGGEISLTAIAEAIDAFESRPGQAFDASLDLKAVLEEKTYKIDFSKNGGGDGILPDPVNKKYKAYIADTAVLSTSDLKRTGYEDAPNWNTKADGSGITVSSTKKVNEVFSTIKAADPTFTGTEVTLYADWKSLTSYTATLSASLMDNSPTIKDVGSPWTNSGSVYQIAQNNKTIQLPEMVETVDKTKNQISFNDPSSGTYELTGWTTQSYVAGVTPDADKVYGLGATVTLTDNATFYPIWTYTEAEKKITKITLNNNVGQTGLNTIDNTYTTSATEVLENQLQGSKIKIDNPFEAPQNMHFAGWTTEKNAAVASTVAGADYTVGSIDATLYAVWAVDQVKYEFYQGTSTTPKATRTVAFNSGDTLAAISGLSISDLRGWATTSGSKNADFATGRTGAEVYEALGTKTIKLYAVIDSAPLTVNYYGGNAANFNASKAVTSVAKNESFKLDATATADNAKLVGWTLRKPYTWEEDVPSTVTVYKAGESYPAGEETLTFYAVFKHEFTVTYDGNGKTSGTMNPTKTVDATVALEKNGFYKAGSEFLGWDTNALGTTVVYEDQATVPSNIGTVYAVWGDKSYTVTYDKNSDKVTGSIRKVIVDADNTATTAVVNDNTGLTAPTGVTFEGWAIDSSATVADITAADIEKEKLDSTSQNKAKYQNVIDKAEAAGKVASDGTIELFAVWSLSDEWKAKDEAAAAKEAQAVAEQLQKEAEEAAKEAEAAKGTAEENEKAAVAAQKKAEAAQADAVAAQKQAEAAKGTAEENEKKAVAAQKQAEADKAKAESDAAAAQAQLDKEAAAKSDGSAKGTPAKKNSVLKTKAGVATGYKVTNASAKAPKVTFAGTAALKKNAVVKITKTTKDQSGNKYTVTAIAAKALYKAQTREVTIANSVKTIGASAFQGSKVETITINMDKKGSTKFGKNALKVKAVKKLKITVKGVAKANQAKVKKAIQAAGAKGATVVFK